MRNMIEICCDCYDIVNRLKWIDKSYKIFFNLNRGCFEVHSFEQSKGSYCFTIPYDEIDQRTLDYALKTRSENRDKLIREIEENNRRIEEKNLKTQVNTMKELLCR